MIEKVIKKDGTTEPYQRSKIINAIGKSAERVMMTISGEDACKVCEFVEQRCEGQTSVHIDTMHNLVEAALDQVNHSIATSYREYRNYKKDFVHMLDEVYKKSQSIRYIGDNSNANTDSALVSTQRSLIYSELNSELYKKFFLNKEELEAMKDGYIYIHDRSARLDTINCCLADVANVLKGGFELGNVRYNEPKTLDVAFDVISDIAMTMAASQYGGYTMPRIDTILAPYAEKSYQKYYDEYLMIVNDNFAECFSHEKADIYAKEKVRRDFEQGFQAWEYRFNTVGSSRGDYPFISISFGIDTSEWGVMASEVCLEVRKKGQGAEGFKKPVLFPKLTFLYDENLHGEGKEFEWLFDCAIECSRKAMYPDFLSLTGEGYIPSIYKKYGQVISLMGCVDGKELVTYKIDGEIFAESIERMWKRLSEVMEPIGQMHADDQNLGLALQFENVEIYDTLEGFVKIDSMIRNVQSEWCDVSIGGDRKIRVTNDHPFETPRGVVLAKDLKTSDKILISYSHPEADEPWTMDNAWWYGFMLCDGCYDGQLGASIAATGEDDIMERFIRESKELTGLDVKIVLRERGDKGTYYDLRLESQTTGDLKNLAMGLERLFGGLQKIYRQVPTMIFNCCRKDRLSFLAGMIDADGYINSNRPTPKVQIGSTNKELALQQLALAQSLGMPAKMYHNHYNSQDPSKIRYRVEFVPNQELIEELACAKKIKHAVNAPVSQHKENVWQPVISVTSFTKEQYSYDVSTASEHFEVSGIYSHNCRASLSPWYERGGMYPADENDTPVYEGRCNLGAISLHLPMILAKARQENKDFYEVLDYYLELIRKLHKKTYAFLAEKKASIYPLAFCEGGFLGGNLKPDEKIGKLLPPMTMSFGITALNELQELYDGHSLVTGGDFALDVMKYINDKVNQYKEEDHILYAIYGTPAESLCGLQIEQFRKKYGIVKNVSDRPYVSNSFHCHVTEEITPIEKQDLEGRFWNYFNGGKIQYVKYPIDYNVEAIKTLIRRAMDKGFYEGVNLSLSYCEECGHEELNMDKCPKCGSELVTQIDRMNGYLGYSRVHGKTRYNDAKMAEIKERVSM